MCGIVGYIGNKQALPIIIEGIKRLEYRGYDSSGIAIINTDGELVIHKKEGKIVELEQSFPKGVNFETHLGIAHTRWATHGEPTALNAHPHIDCTGKIAVVHNGIIENYKLLRDKLEREGHTFISDTDTEVIAHLIEQFYLKCHDMHNAVRMMLKQVEGTLGIAAINLDVPEKLYAARRGSPLIIGVGDDQNFIASDAAALVVHTKNVIYLQDDETAEISADDFTIKTITDDEVQREISKINWDISMIDKGEYDFFMMKEIFEQPTTIANAFRGRIMDIYNTSRLGGISLSVEELNSIKKICIVACGTSWHAGMVGQYLPDGFQITPEIVSTQLRIQIAFTEREDNAGIFFVANLLAQLINRLIATGQHNRLVHTHNSLQLLGQRLGKAECQCITKKAEQRQFDIGSGRDPGVFEIIGHWIGHPVVLALYRIDLLVIDCKARQLICTRC